MNSIRRCRDTALVILTVATFLSDAGAETFVTKYVGRDCDGTERWQAVTTIRPIEGEGRYLLTEEGAGIYTGYRGPVRWKADATFASDAKGIRPSLMTKTVSSKEGTILLEETQEFDLGKREVVCRKWWPLSGKTVSKKFRYEGDAVNKLLLGLYIQKFLEHGAREKIFCLVSDEPSLYKVVARVKGVEEVAVNGTKETAYRIVLDPLIGLLSPLEMFLPKAHVWHLARPNFKWLKYRGVEETVTSPLIEIETLDRQE